VRLVSRNAGDGERVGLGASNKARGFEGEDLGCDKAMAKAEGETSRLWCEMCSVKEVACSGSPCGPSGTVVVEDNEDMVEPERRTERGIESIVLRTG
jgi:hypothetical protein